jgi:acrylyl-CoA reductase (NADPH)
MTFLTTEEGIHTNSYDMAIKRQQKDRLEAWQRLADILDPAVFEDISADISLTEVVEVAGDLIAGKIRGRVVVNISE